MLIEDLAYRRLLDLYYLHERPLNTDATVVAKQIGMRDNAAAVRDVLNEFFDLTPDGYRSSRADKEIEHYHSKIQQASRAGKASAERRLNGRSTDVPTDVQPTNNQEPITNNHKPKTQKKAPAVLCPLDVDQKVWDDYMVIRKAKNLPVTETALADIRREAEKAGLGMGEVIRECVTRGWAGFKAKWLVEKMTLAEQRMNTMHQLTGGITTPKVGNFWDKPKTDVIEVENVERKRLL